MLNKLFSTDLKSFEVNSEPTGLFRVSQNSKTLDFLNKLYTDQSQFRVKWNTLDELNNDSFSVKNPLTTYTNTVDDLFTTPDNKIETTKYPIKAYVEGYVNKVTSTKFTGIVQKNYKLYFKKFRFIRF